MSTMHVANLVANIGNTAYGVKSINGLIDVSIQLFIDWFVQHNFRHTKMYNNHNYVINLLKPAKAYFCRLGHR